MRLFKLKGPPQTGTVLGEVDLPSCRSTEEAFEAFFQGSQLNVVLLTFFFEFRGFDFSKTKQNLKKTGSLLIFSHD